MVDAGYAHITGFVVDPAGRPLKARLSATPARQGGEVKDSNAVVASTAVIRADDGGRIAGSVLAGADGCYRMTLSIPGRAIATRLVKIEAGKTYSLTSLLATEEPFTLPPVADGGVTEGQDGVVTIGADGITLSPDGYTYQTPGVATGNGDTYQIGV